MAAQIILKKELSARIGRTPGYSMRAFAKFLSLSPSYLSEVLAGKKFLSKKKGDKILERLSLSPQEQNIWNQSFAPSRDPSYLVLLEKMQRMQLSEDVFYIIKDWYHYAILSLIKTPSFKFDNRWIAKTLGITVVESKEAMARLLNLGLISIKDEKVIRTKNSLTSTNDFSSKAIQSFHYQILQKAQQSLDSDPPAERDFSSVTVASTPEKMAKAKQMIRTFRRKLAHFLEDGPAERVFQISIQFFPLSKNTNNSNNRNLQ